MSRVGKFLGLVLLVAAGVYRAAQAGDISLSQSLDRSEIPYEEKAVLEIVVSWHGNQAAYRFDRPLQPKLDKLRVREFSSTISSEGSGTDEVTTKRFRYALVPTSSGTGRIEPMVINYASWPDSLPGELVTEAMTLSIAPARKVAKPASLTENLRILLAVAAGIVVVGGVGLGLFIRARNKRPKPVVQTPAELFLERLEQLRTESSGDLKKFQTGLYKQLLWYLSAQFGLQFSNEPVEEIVKRCESVGMPTAQKAAIGNWLLQADRVKFSPVEPAPGETVRLESEIRRFFETITPTRNVED
ncbi:MAG: BatD family protein [Candidatus Zixiibacteriota bacterium]